MSRPFRQPPATSRRRGFSAIGFELLAGPDLVLEEIASGETVLRVVETSSTGAPIGELEIALFTAALIIDRDGLLSERATQVAQAVSGVAATACCEVTFPGAAGFRADAVIPGRPSLPYVHAFALAPVDGIDGGVILTMRTATTDWQAGESLLYSFKMLTRTGAVPASDDVPTGPMLPFTKR